MIAACGWRDGEFSLVRVARPISAGSCSDKMQCLSGTILGRFSVSEKGNAGGPADFGWVAGGTEWEMSV